MDLVVAVSKLVVAYDPCLAFDDDDVGPKDGKAGATNPGADGMEKAGS